MVNKRTCALLLCLAVVIGGALDAQRSAPAGAIGKTSDQASCDAKKAVGRWSGDRYSMEILGDGAYRASGTPNMASIDVTGTLKFDQCRATFVDTSGQYACPPGEVGQYTFAVTGSTLRFTLVSDPCDGRRLPLARGSLTRMPPSK